LKILSLVYTGWRDLKGDFVVFERTAFEGIKDIWSSLEIFPERFLCHINNTVTEIEHTKVRFLLSD
jgi:hypothetical protein